MQIKIHSAYRNITALADTNLIDKTFIEGRKRIDITSKFFKDKEISKKEAIKILKNMEKEDSTFFIVGKKSIETAIEARADVFMTIEKATKPLHRVQEIRVESI